MSDHSNTGGEPASGRAPVVLQVLPSLVAGGVERGTVDVAAAIVDAGWTALVASSGGPMVREIERAGATHLTLPVHSKNPLVMRRNIGWIAEAIDTRSVDIVHARSRAPAWSAWAAARRAGRPLVTGFHGTYNASNPVKRWYNGIMAKGDRVIAISDFIAEHARATYGVDEQRLRTIHRGIDVNVYDAGAVTPARMIGLAEKWRLPDGAPVVMLPGRMARWKGHAVLVDAIAQLGRPDLRCLLVGASATDQRYCAELRRRIADRGMQANIAIVEHCDDMPAAYMLADVVVSASVEPEAFGRVAAEAQAMGRPVVATDHGGARETVIPGRGGWLVPPGDVGATARALTEALALDAAARSDLAPATRAHIRAHFTVETMCRRTLDLYRELLPSQARGR